MNEFDIVLYKIIGDMLREKRLMKGYTLDYVADKIGVTKKTVQRYEVGERKIQVSTLVKLSETLDYDYDLFMEQAQERMLIEVKSQKSEKNTIATLRRLAAYKSKLSNILDQLSEDNKKKVLDYANRIYETQQMEDALLNAAHSITGSTEEDIKHDDEIMNDKDF